MVFQETQRNPIIRRSSSEDMDQLVEACRLSFPNSLLWQSDRWLARQWWKSVLVSRAVETWIIEDHGIVTAFCVLIVDEDLWSKERILRHGSIMMNLLSALSHPIIATRRVGQVCGRVMKKNTPPVLHKQMPAGWNSKMRTWIGLIAVRPHRRNEGLAGMLLNHCDCETKELGRRAIALRVVSDNAAAKLLYERHGYVCC